jgi:excisionase family DNA binding protein
MNNVEPAIVPKNTKPKVPEPGQSFTVGQVAYRLQVSDSTVIRMIEGGSLPGFCIKAGKRKKIWRVRPEALESWMRARERESQRMPKPAA